MKAWLVTWEWCGDHARVDAPLISIFGSRRSDRIVANFVEQHYMLATSNAQEVTRYANRGTLRPYKATTSQIINGIPHGDRVVCGHNPFIYARRVFDLRIEVRPEAEVETVCWQEPPTYKWQDERRLAVTVDKEGARGELARAANPLLPWVGAAG